MQQGSRTRNFNPLSLYRERPTHRFSSVKWNTFQSTLPIQGETTKKSSKALENMVFQSTLPIQGETCTLFVLSQLLNISIHSPYTGRDVTHLLAIYSISHISIHSPYTGRDVLQKLQSTGIKSISIHSPYTGRDANGCEGVIRVWRISIHSPYTGRDDRSIRVIIQRAVFQSTLPIQGETT